MGANTKIEWADHSWSPWWGCTKVSVGDKGACENCYAEVLAHRFGVGWGPHALRKLNSPGYWREPERWDRRAEREGTRPFVFPSMCDPFDNQVDPEWRRWFFARIRSTPNLVWLLLTKRPSMIERLSAEAGGLPRNAAIGASVVTPLEAERDVRTLLRAKALLRPAFAFLSCEPMMEGINFRQWLHAYGCGCGWGGDEPLDYCNNCAWRGLAPGEIGDPCPNCCEPLADFNACPECDGHDGDGMHFGPNSTWLDWIIAGGESGPHARPSHPDWFRALRDQCAAAGVPFLFKQWGEWAPELGDDGLPASEGRRGPLGAVLESGAWRIFERGERHGDVFRVGKKAAGRLLDGVEHNGFPTGFERTRAAA